MTLSEATKAGYKILSGPYRIPHQERMMLAALDSLGKKEHKVVTSGTSWYIVRKHMLEVEPETEIPEAQSCPRVHITARITDESYGLAKDFMTTSKLETIGQVLDHIILDFFKVKK